MSETQTEQIGEMFGERVADVSANLHLSDDELLAKIHDLREQAAAIRGDLFRAEDMMAMRLRDRQATVYESAAWSVKLVPSVEYKYDTTALSKLVGLGYVTTDDWVGVIDWTPKVSKLALNKLAKRGGEVKAIIEAATTTVERAPRLEIKGRENGNG